MHSAKNNLYQQRALQEYPRHIVKRTQCQNMLCIVSQAGLIPSGSSKIRICVKVPYHDLLGGEERRVRKAAPLGLGSTMICPGGGAERKVASFPSQQPPMCGSQFTRKHWDHTKAADLTCIVTASAAFALVEDEVVFVLDGFAALRGRTDTDGEVWLLTSFWAETSSGFLSGWVVLTD